MNTEGRRSIKVPVFQTMNGEDVSISVHQFGSSNTGPSIYVGAGTHGNELQGVEICRRLLADLESQDVFGTVTIIPVQNPLAQALRIRLNPIDNKDLDLAYPGKNNGTATERLASVLFGFASSADCVIDLHSGGVGSKNIPHIYVPWAKSKKSKFSSIETAAIFGADVLIATQPDVDYHFLLPNLSPFYCNGTTGAAGLYVELGEGGLVDDYFVEFGRLGVMNVLRKMGVIKGDVQKQGKLQVVRSTQVVRSPSSGILKREYDLGKRVTTDELLAKVYSLDGKTEAINSPCNGIIQWTVTFGNTNAGDDVCWIGEDPADYTGM